MWLWWGGVWWGRVWWGGVGVLVGLTMGVRLLCLADEKLLLLSEVE